MAWHVIKVRTGSEAAVSRRLAEVGVDVPVPVEWRLTRPHRRAPKRHYRKIAMRTGHLPVRSSSTSAVVQAEAKGVIGIVSRDGVPVHFAEREVAGMLAAAARPEPALPTTWRPKQGDIVRVVSGPFLGRLLRIRSCRGGRARSESDGVAVEVPVTVLAPA